MAIDCQKTSLSRLWQKIAKFTKPKNPWRWRLKWENYRFMAELLGVGGKIHKTKESMALSIWELSSYRWHTNTFGQILKKYSWKDHGDRVSKDLHFQGHGSPGGVSNHTKPKNPWDWILGIVTLRIFIHEGIMADLLSKDFCFIMVV